MRWPFISRAVVDFAPRSLLEVGCGQGAMGTRLVTLTPDYVAVEPDRHSFESARARLEPLGGRVVNGTVEDLPTSERFDTVCAFEVLEHFEDEDEPLQQWRARLHPGGQLVLSVPAFQEMFGPWDAAVGHYRRYSPDQLAVALNRNGFRPAHLDVYGWPLALVLEKARNRIISRRGSTAAVEQDPAPTDMADRTSRSGRLLQPGRGLAGAAMNAAVWPFSKVQRLRPRSGNGIVAVAYRVD
jgi:SAM-dependent methyltransferase